MNASQRARLTEAADRVRLASLAERRARRAVKAADAKADEAREVVRVSHREADDARFELLRLASA